MEWIKRQMGTNPLYSERMVALRPHEAKVIASAFEQPLNDYKEQLENIKTMRLQGEPTTRAQDYKQLLLEEIIDVVGEFVSSLQTPNMRINMQYLHAIPLLMLISVLAPIAWVVSTISDLLMTTTIYLIDLLPNLK